MSKREAIARYNLIIKRVRKSPCTFQEIINYLKLESELQEYNFVVSKRTFQRDLKDIDSLFNIEIKYNGSTKAYHIVEEFPDASNRILEAFDTFHALNMSGQLSDYIHFESRKPLGTEHFYGLLHAIKNRVVIEFNYQKYWDDHISQRKVHPYALKEYRQRWYVVAKDQKDQRIKTFSLDRMTFLHISKQHFIYPPDFSVSEYFNGCFGIIRGSKKTLEDIELQFSAFQGKYIKSLKLHHSQETIEDTKNALTIKLKMHITHDSIMEILSMGSEVKVLKPARFAEDIKKRLLKTLENYENHG